MPIRKSHSCQRAICYISDTDMIYSLALSALGFVSEIPRLRPPCRMPPFVSNVLCPYESNDKAKAENLSKVVLTCWSGSISLSNLLLKCPRVRQFRWVNYMYGFFAATDNVYLAILIIVDNIDRTIAVNLHVRTTCQIDIGDTVSWDINLNVLRAYDHI